MRQLKNGDGITVAVVGSMTTALSAQRALATAAIRSEIVKQDSTGHDTAGGRGCSYGVAFSSAQRGNVRAILSAAHINVRRYTNEEWQIP